MEGCLADFKITNPSSSQLHMMEMSEELVCPPPVGYLSSRLKKKWQKHCLHTLDYGAFQLCNHKIEYHTTLGESLWKIKNFKNKEVTEIDYTALA